MSDKEPVSTKPSTQSKNRRFGLFLLLALVMAGLILVFVVILQPSNTSSSTASNEISPEAKGGLINTPAVVTLPATGPVEPTRSAALPVTKAPTLAAAPTVVARVPTTVLPTLTPVPTPSLRLIPKRIRIEAMGVNTFVERLGVDKKGNMDVPKNIFNVGWFGDGGYTPGDNGNAVIAGHLDAPGTRAVFWDLDKLKPGDKIVLSDDARELTFEVVRLQTYPYNNAPLLDIFGPATEPHLNLITCNGTYDRASANYNKRLIVFSRLLGKSF